MNDIFDIYQNSDVINSFVVSRLNLISLLNKFFTDREQIEMDELFKIATFADNINDKFTKNISKLILGKIILQTQSAQNAISIYTKQLEYFAKEKNAEYKRYSEYVNSDEYIEKIAREKLRMLLPEEKIYIEYNG